MSEFINTIDVLGDDIVLASIVDKSITEFKDNELTHIGGYALAQCKALTIVDLPSVTTLGECALYECSGITSINLPALTTLGENSIRGMILLTSLCLPALTGIPSYSFFGSNALKTADFWSVTSIKQYAFTSCSSLTALILRSETMCSLANTNAFTSSSIKNGGTGYIYVPRALVDSYKSATNWSTYATQFRALEDYTVDGTITGELDSTKI